MKYNYRQDAFFNLGKPHQKIMFLGLGRYPIYRLCRNMVYHQKGTGIVVFSFSEQAQTENKFVDFQPKTYYFKKIGNTFL
jgi:hypothetical protein